LLIPVLYVNQEMVLRLGTVTGVGHARLMLERSAASGGLQRDRSVPADALTIVTAFIGISLAGAYDATYTDLDGRLVLAGGLVLWRIVQLAVSAG
jgi:hypothetical protein